MTLQSTPLQTSETAEDDLPTNLLEEVGGQQVQHCEPSLVPAPVA